MKADSLGDRMKGYEDSLRIKAIRRAPKVIRIDGKAFHTYLANARKPYDTNVAEAMNKAAVRVMKEIGGTARFAYIQSDEVSIVLNDGLDLNTQAWFDNNLQKIVSVSSSIFTAKFNKEFAWTRKDTELAFFDARLLVLPDTNELCNYLVWRQQDAIRNSVQQYGRHYFSSKELHEKSCEEIKKMLKETHGFSWLEAEPWTTHGYLANKNTVEITAAPLFTENRPEIITRYNPDEEMSSVSE
jgi:tRNA(His) guanylyltransferase